nr:MAG: hypothetical protein BRC90_00110 [Halobacteriales archaeon QS_4_69_34]
MASNVRERSVAAVVERVLADATGDSFVTPCSAATVETLIEVLDGLDRPAAVTLLAEEDALSAAFESFLVAGTAAGLIAADTLSVRAGTAPDEGLLLATEERVVSVVESEERVRGLTTDDGAFVASVRERYADASAAAEPFSIQTPPLSRLHGTLRADLGPNVAEEFERVLASQSTLRDGAVDEVVIALLITAREEGLLYDISKWGEDVGFASKATFSRVKSRLEDRGLVGTEKVPIDVGRPRLRLHVDDERLGAAPPEELVTVGRELLAESA